MLDPEKAEKPRQRRRKLSPYQTKKDCLNCGKSLGLSLFYSYTRHNASRMTYSSNCKSCTNKRRKARSASDAAQKPPTKLPTKSVIEVYRDHRATGGELTLRITGAKPDDQWFIYAAVGDTQWAFDVSLLCTHGGVQFKMKSVLDEYNEILADRLNKLTPQKGTNQ